MRRPGDCECVESSSCDHARLAAVVPLVTDLLLPTAREDGLVVAIADRSGRLAYVEGHRSARDDADSIGFAVGEDWSQAQVGRNAPGLAVAQARAVSVRREEHTRPDVHPFSCSAAPLLDPVSGEVLGAIDVTGGDVAADPHCLALVQATAAAAQRELKLVDAGPTVLPPTARVPRLNLVRRSRPFLEVDGVKYLLSDRHAELLTLLVGEPSGMSSEELAAHAYPDGAPTATVRGDMLRLRRRLGEIPGAPGLESRPYRLAGELQIDAGQVIRRVEQGDYDGALDLYRGRAFLPESDRVGGLVEAAAMSLREAMLSDAGPDSLLRYLELPEVQHDPEPWKVALQILPPRAAQRAVVVAHLEALDARM